MKFRLLVLAMTTATLLGCGGSADDRGVVVGTILMNGQPLPNAVVLFNSGQGRPSQGITDAQGKYELKYSSQQKGAVPGHYSVMISPLELSDDAAKTAKNTVRIPAKYNSKTELTADVKPGKNAIDFALTSE
ncbi:carboxypeptidase-like regulatory domain-containing protein [Planctomicrobium sp. SH664]|uniref:carboxypeptidase-like regulatory domain-containing protein n=1 Tax=Planctomicrobium sp. SH664 TaxID=3448125 RepID=UPI003F5B5CBB